MTELQQTWVYLQSAPLFWLTLTLLAFQAADALYKKSGHYPLLNPVLLSVVFLVLVLKLSGTDYASYFSGAQFVHFLLGPATVALAVPLYHQIGTVRKAVVPILIALFVGSLFAILSAVGIGWLFGASKTVLMSMAPKSVTTPIAMGISEKIGGLPSLTAVIVICSGIAGASMGGWMLDRLRIKLDMARGFAMGVAAHGIGTARAFQMSPAAGAFSGLAMGLNGLVTALLLPLLLELFR